MFINKTVFKNKNIVIKLCIDLTLFFCGIILSCIQNNTIIFGFSISLSTTTLLDAYQLLTQIDNYSKDFSNLGLVDFGYNQNKKLQEKIFNNAKNLKMIFCSGNVTMQTYKKQIETSIIKNNCHVKILISDANDDMFFGEKKDEWKITINCVKQIIDIISKETNLGSIELRITKIPPIAFLEIRNDSFCVVSPYLQKMRINEGYYAKYKNTRNPNDIYHKWIEHFDNMWETGKTIVSGEGLKQ